MYTKRVYELLEHHLVQGFDFEKYRETDFLDIENVEHHQTKKRNFLDGYRERETNYKRTEPGKGSSLNVSHKNSASKEAYIGIRLINPQLNMQDENVKAQALITTEGSATAVFFAYSEPEKASVSAVKVTYTGSKWKTNIVKKEVCVQVDEMHLYVAPTFINLEKPTFWNPNNSKKQGGGAIGKRPSSEMQENDDKSIEEENSNTLRVMRSGSHGQEDRDDTNVLRKILSFTSMSCKYVFRGESESD